MKKDLLHIIHEYNISINELMTTDILQIYYTDILYIYMYIYICIYIYIYIYTYSYKYIFILI